MKDESTLRQKARELIQSGKLPAKRPERMWGGRGSDVTCAICGDPLKADQFEFELQFTADSAGAVSSVCRVHVRCFAAWELEREELDTSGLNGVLRSAEHGDTIAHRERDSAPKREPG
jgi:hypothetical protein